MPRKKSVPFKIKETKEFIEVGGSPLPGITLQQVLRGHTGYINRIAWSPDGRYLASPSEDNTIRVWDVEHGECIAILKGHENRVFCVAWSPNGRMLASGSGYPPDFADSTDNNVRVWQTTSWENIRIFSEHKAQVTSLSWSPDSRSLASASFDGIIKVRDINYEKQMFTFQALDDQVREIVWLVDRELITHSNNSIVSIWDLANYVRKDQIAGPSSNYKAFCWSPNFVWLAAADSKHAISIWDLNTKKQIKLLEGHTNGICNLSISFDGNMLASNSYDNTVRLWRTDTWDTVAILDQNNIRFLPLGLAFHPFSHRIATLCESDKAIRIWDIDYSVLVGNLPTEKSISYTTAKLVLVGDAGVGKTGLGWRLAHNEYKEHSSTHGQQFWVVPELGKKRDDGTECEAVLWDLAGQPDYRLVHSLYLDDVDAALILFDPTNRQEPLSGVDFWLNQLKAKDKQLRNSILVGGRIDRGTSTMTEAEIQAYCKRNGISGGYIPTSALAGNGLAELLEKLKAQIPWNQMTTTVTTITFKRIKEFVLKLKGKLKQEYVLVQPDELREQLQATDSEWQFSDAEMMTAVGHLETHGYVKIIHSSNGQHSILLEPDILVNLASSIVLEARRNAHGLGVLEEERLLHGEYPFPELNNISKMEGIILLDAAAVLFLQRNLCFRETFNNQTFLVFPSLINEKRPIDETIKIEEGASYRVKGAVENVYASLVVLLGYTNTFTRTHQWQNQAQYEMGESEVCGFIQSENQNGEIELVLYFDQKTPDPVRLTFRGLFERFLTRRELEIFRYQPVTCHKCGSPLARNVVMDQLKKGKDFSFCHDCGEKLQLPNPEPVSRLSRREEVIMDIQQAVAQRRTAFEAALVRVKGLLRDQDKEKAPTCFISYAWGTQEHQRWVMQLAKDLRHAGADVLLDRWYIVPGANLDRYIEQIMSTDFVVVVGTPGLQQKYNSKTTDPVVSAELEMLNLRARQPNKYGHTILPILVEGDSDSAFSPQLQKLVYVDFRQSAFYFRQLFDMIWRMYNLAFDNPLIEELHESMTPQEKP